MKRKKHEEHANHERWLVSYADFITLLFAFFVVMYAASEVDARRMKEVVGSIAFALHFEGTGGIDEPAIFDGPRADQVQTEREEGKGSNNGLDVSQRLELLEIKEAMEYKLNSGPSGGIASSKAVQIAVTEHGLRIRLLEAYFFDPGSAVLRPEAIPVADAIARVLKPLPNNLRIEGHSDAQKANSAEYANWEISTNRALTILRFFLEGHAIDPPRLSIAAFSHYRPVATNESPEGRALNRRIDIFVLTGENEAAVE